MKLLNLFFMVGVFLFSCRDNGNKEPVLIYKNPLAERALKGFIKSIADNDTSDNVVTMYVSVHNDSTTLAIADSYPILAETTFNNFENIAGYKVFYVGAKDNILYTVKSGVVPDEILEREKSRHDPKKPPKFLDPKLWEFHFKKDSLVEFYPQEEIKKFVQL